MVGTLIQMRFKQIFGTEYYKKSFFITRNSTFILRTNSKYLVHYLSSCILFQHSKVHPSVPLWHFATFQIRMMIFCYNVVDEQFLRRRSWQDRKSVMPTAEHKWLVIQKDEWDDGAQPWKCAEEPLWVWAQLLMSAWLQAQRSLTWDAGG